MRLGGASTVEDGGRVAEGALAVSPVPEGDVARLGFPPTLIEATAAELGDKRWLTVTASLAADMPCTAAGHQVAFARRSWSGLRPSRPGGDDGCRTPG